MRRSIKSRIGRIAVTLPHLVERLRALGYAFARPDDVLPGVEPTVDDNISRIEREVGTVPLAVALYWRTVGSVDLCGSHPNWRGCEYPDPLVISPSAHAVEELESFLEDREERIRCGFPFLTPIAPDDLHKENVSGGMWYNVSCPDESDDPIVNDERHHLPFLDYLELALEWGGFPGLDRARGHSWPVEALRSGDEGSPDDASANRRE